MTNLLGVIEDGAQITAIVDDAKPIIHVEVQGAGPKGEQGIQGEQGPKGEPGVGLQYEWVGSKLGIKTEAESDFEYVDLAAASGDIAYTHNQISASREWLVCHNLGKHPSVTVVDSASTVVVGDIAYLNTEELIISFTSEFSGRAFLN